MRLVALASVLLLLGPALSGCGGGESSGRAPSAGDKRARTSATGSMPNTGSQSTPPDSHEASPSSREASPSSHEVSPGVVRASAQGVDVTMRASGHHPHVNRPWPVSFTVIRAGRPARARVRYEYLFAGQVVAHRSNYGFTGSFRDVFVWPPSALGYPLTFRAVVTAGKATLSLDYAVQVIR